MEFFAYGSMQPGGEFYDQIATSVVGSTDAYFDGRLFVHREYPIVVEDDDGYPVRGVLLHLPDSPLILQRMDQIEGVRMPDSPYMRVQRRLITDHGDSMAWIYVCKFDHRTAAMQSTELRDGDWLAHSRSSPERS